MNRAIFLLCAGATTLALTGCATMDHRTSRAESADTLANAQALAASTGAVDVAANTAMYFGDRWTATNLYEHAENSGDRLYRRFNLAQGYEATGRLREAADLYRSLAADGEFRAALTRDETGRMIRVNMADEAARRAAAIEARLTYASTDGVVAAADVGAPVLATVGAAPPTYITDEEALRRDAVENPIR